MGLFAGFETFDIDVEGVTIHGVKGGEGPPLLLLHGYPQTHVMWHKVAPELAKTYTLIIPDLRGYGRSSKPESKADFSNQSKRAMAADMVGVMRHFGFEQFFVGSHDRGSRVAHRMALDWPDAVKKLAVLDIAPTREMYANTSDGFARAYWHWFFLIQKAPFPEQMILADPKAYLLGKFNMGAAKLSPFTEETIAAYIEGVSELNTIRCACDDYRAAATIDIAHDNADGDRKVECPMLALWGKNGVIEAHFDCLVLWRQRAKDVTGEAIEAGHYIAEEKPDEVIRHFQTFFKD